MNSSLLVLVRLWIHLPIYLGVKRGWYDSSLVGRKQQEVCEQAAKVQRRTYVCDWFSQPVTFFARHSTEQLPPHASTAEAMKNVDRRTSEKFLLAHVDAQ